MLGDVDKAVKRIFRDPDDPIVKEIEKCLIYWDAAERLDEDNYITKSDCVRTIGHLKHDIGQCIACMVRKINEPL